MKALKDLRRYDEDYDEGGYIGISVDHEGEYYKCSDVEALLEESMPKWVSVDERLPDKPGAYWVSITRKAEFGFETYRMHATFDMFWEYTSITHYLDNVPPVPEMEDEST